MVNILVWIVVGAIAGWLAGQLMGNREGLVGNIILGIVGSLVGGFTLSVLGVQAAESGLSLGHILTATFGAVIVIAVVRAIRRA